MAQIRLTLEQPDRISNIGNDRRQYKHFVGEKTLVVAWHVHAKAAIIRTVFWQE